MSNSMPVLFIQCQDKVRFAWCYRSGAEFIDYFRINFAILLRISADRITFKKEPGGIALPASSKLVAHGITPGSTLYLEVASDSDGEPSENQPELMGDILASITPT